MANLTNTTPNTLLSGTSDNDTIYNEHSSNVTVLAGGGNDFIVNRLSGGGEFVSINGGDGSDTIENWINGGNSTLLGGAGDDSIVNHYADNVTIIGGTGNDVLSNISDSTDGKNVVFSYANGDGNDTIRGFDETSTLKISGTKYSSQVSGSDIIVTAGDGKIILVDAASLKSVYITATLSGGVNLTNTTSNTVVNGTSDNDTLDNSGNNVTINAGAGDDSIHTYGVDPTITAYSFGKANLINAGDGNDIIYTNSASSSIDGGAGNDSITNTSYGVSSTITGGDGNDSIRNSANAKISGGNGNDTIINTNLGARATLLGGAGSDYISSYNSDSVSINGGKGNDSIVTSGATKYVTVAGGAGNDTLLNDGSSVLFSYADGDGSDIIYGFSTTNTLQIADGIYSTAKSGSDIIVTVGSGKITLVGAANLSTVNIDGKKSSTNKWTLSGTTAKYGTSSKTLVTVKGVTSLSGLKLNSKVVTVSEESLGTNKITISDGYTLKLASDVTKTSTKKSWTFSNSTAAYKQTTSAGYKLSDNAISYSKKSTKTLATVKGVTSKSGLSVSGKVVTVKAASLGTEKITISDGYTLKLGSDVDSSTTKKSWTLINSTAAYKQVTSAGYKLSDNAISYSKKSTKTLATVKGVKDKSGLTVSGKTIKLAASALSKKVTVSGAYTFDFAAGYSNATITGSSSNDTIIARGKNISVKGGSGADIFAVKPTVANVISDYAAEDKISLTSGAADFSVSGNDLIINGKISVTGGANKSVTYIDADGEHVYKKNSDDVKFNSKGTVATLLETYEEDSFDPASYPDYQNKIITIKASAVKHSLDITGNKNANKITATSEDDTLHGLAGGDTLHGGKGNDQLYGGAGNDSLNGGSGNDSLWGGTGSDTLVGGTGEDVFIYSDGDGKDTISDYAPGIDTVMILGGKVGNPLAGTSGDVTFKIGSAGQLTFTDSAAKNITLVDKDGNILSKYIS